jgi:hypothetical protein
MPQHSHALARRNGRVAVAIIINLCFTVSNHVNNHSFILGIIVAIIAATPPSKRMANLKFLRFS